MCAAARAKRQAVAPASVPDVAAVSAYAPESSKYPPGIILEVVRTASPDRRCSCKEHACCEREVLQEDVVIHLCWEQILVPDNVAGNGKMKEMAIIVNWVLDGVDRRCVGFLPHTYVVQGEIWDGVLCQVVDVFEKNDPSKQQQEKWHHNKGYALIAVISCMPLSTGARPQKKVKDVGMKSGGKRGK
jgi:hypothetical protein